MSTIPWSLKYAPETIDDMVLDDDLKKMFNGILSTRSLSNISLIGKPGVGKTTVAKILMDGLDCDVMFHPCSIDGSIDTVKTKIKNFTEIIPKNDYKIVVLDEADQLSQQAQMALRNIIHETMDKCRFILTANYQDKLIEALTSRCTPVKIEFSTKDVLTRCISILKAEGVKYTKESMKSFLTNVIEKRYPDIRSIISSLQIMCVTGKLDTDISESMVENVEIVNWVKENIGLKIKEIRSKLLSNEDKFSGDYVKLGEGLFNAYMDDPEILLVISEHLYRMSCLLDKEIQFTSMIIKIKNILKER